MVHEWIVENFRGISDPVMVDLRAKGTGEATSLVLLGDNGSGKSSLVDALEFCLRGRLSRRSGAGAKRRREVRNLASRQPPAVITTLSDGRSVKRGGGLSGLGPQPIGRGEMVPEFSVSPIIVRRHDVESFWLVSPKERQSFFFDYLRSDYRAIVLPEKRAALLAAHENARHRLVMVRRRMREVGNVIGEELPTNLRSAREFLEKTLLPAAGEGPPERKTLPRNVQRAYDLMVSVIDETNRLDGEVRALSADEPDDTKIRGVLNRISDRVSENFAKVARIDWVDSVNLDIGEDQEFDIMLDLSEGTSVAPDQVLSEAALDLLALLIIVEVHVECSTLGQSKLIVFDDVFQSVDSTHRVHAMDHILARLGGWQVIVTVHDRLWMELVRSSLNRAGHHHKSLEALSEGFGNSPRLRGAGVEHSHTLRNVLSRSDQPSLIAAAAGRLLEGLSDKLSVSLACSVTRQAGDKYDLGALWPGVHKILKKHGPAGISEAVADIDRLLTLRNVLGAHYNEWAMSVSTQEANEFGAAVLRLWDLTICPTCGGQYARFRSPSGNREIFSMSCRCADTSDSEIAPDRG
ncbi:AAA family ATPase [Amycolatopsis sp. NBRC 101858]|uniref:AAA family ATPase n=1 Tax=Amycolatopsis sp. NBRC 101858 TaxID=3032200 RepID=UPI0025550D54|nr:AAA family ATPase [Amycolatopsis sp. NBRC 101858]